MSYGGTPCTTTGVYNTDTASYTWINIDNVIDSDGTIDTICVKVFQSGVGDTIYTATITPINVLSGDIVGITQGSSDAERKVIIFRDDGTNYNIVGSGLISTVDYINTRSTAVGATYTWYHSGNVSTNTPKSEWTQSASAVQLIVYASLSGFDNVYVDINKADDTGAGTAWATAKKTMKAGWGILNTLGTMHVATGNYSAQTGWAWNRSWKLSPEDPNTTGEKRVAIPPSV